MNIHQQPNEPAKPANQELNEQAVPGNTASYPNHQSRNQTTVTNDTSLIGTLFAKRYKIREKLGEGGMGSVYVADQVEPVQRRVALKIIKITLANPSALARFEQERQALALMDHPNIAKVLDAGVEEDESVSSRHPRSGLSRVPYFVMELIKGVPITQYCDETKLTPKERLELFIPVCQAVQHAHQKGIIHRDLKPSNILIGLYDGKPVPKVIDFGVAKATGPKLTDQSVYTEVGSLIGTLEYMSPEQAELNNLDIDTRSDVYALGVILYELLTGMVPFSRKEMEQAGLIEMIRIIKEVDPPKPSTKLSHSGELPTVAARRKLEPQRLTQLIKGDLDWIVLKALEKDRNRRYETANSLAVDVQRFLTGEPVAAVPPSPWYRFRKLVSRHRGVALAAGLLLGALCCGILGTSLGMARALQAERREGQEREVAQQEAKRAKESEKLAEQRATEVSQQKVQTQRQLEKSERLLYASYLDRAQQAWKNKRGDLAHHYLNACQWNLRGWEHDYLWTKFHLNQVTLANTDSGSGHSLEFSPDGTLLAAGDVTGTIRLWNVESGQEIWTIPDADHLCHSLRYSPDGHFLYSGSLGQHDVKIWDIRQRKQRTTLNLNGGEITSLDLSADGTKLFATLRELKRNKPNSDEFRGEMKIWDLPSGKEIFSWKNDKQSVDSVACSPDGSLVAVASGNSIRLISLSNYQEIPNDLIHPKEIMSIAFSHDGTKLLTSCLDSNLRVFSVAARVLALTLDHDSVCNAVFSMDDRQIISNSSANGIAVWDSQSGELVREFRGNNDLIWKVAICPKGTRIASAGEGSEDGDIRIWRIDGSQNMERVYESKQVNWRSCINQARTQVALADSDEDPKRIRLVDLLTRQVRDIDTSSLEVESLQFHPNGKELAAGCEDGQIVLWDVSTSLEQVRLKNLSWSVSKVVFHPSGSFLIVLSESRELKKRELGVWDLVQRRIVWSKQWEQDNSSNDIAISNDGNTIVTGGNSKGIQAWDMSNGAELFCVGAEEFSKVRAQAPLVESLCLDPDGRLLAIGGIPPDIHLVDIPSRRSIARLRGHTIDVASLAFHPRAPRLVSSGRDNTVRIWDTKQHIEIMSLNVRDAFSTDLQWSSDGKRLIHVPFSGGINVYDAAFQEPEYQLLDLDAGIVAVGWSSDSRQLYAISLDKKHYVFDAETLVPLESSIPSESLASLHYTGKEGKALAVSPDGRKEVEIYGTVTYRDKLRAAAWRADQQRRLFQWAHPEPAWYLENARQAEKKGHWYAATFHLRQLVHLSPQDEKLKKRLTLAETKMNLSKNR
jgi:WD40 repeat protein/serine/threonine protein kinase